MRADEMQIGAKLTNELWSFSMIHSSGFIFKLNLDYMAYECGHTCLCTLFLGFK